MRLASERLHFSFNRLGRCARSFKRVERISLVGRIDQTNQTILILYDIWLETRRIKERKKNRERDEVHAPREETILRLRSSSDHCNYESLSLMVLDSPRLCFQLTLRRDLLLGPNVLGSKHVYSNPLEPTYINACMYK